MTNTPYRGPLIIIAVIIAAILAYGLLTKPDQRTSSDKISDAFTDIRDGVDNAGRQLENRTPGEKLGDAVKDVGDKIKDNSSQ